MEGESKNLGIRKACPECRKLLVKAAELKDLTGGKVFIQNNCKFCNEPITIEMGMKPYMKVYKTVKLLGFIFLIVASAYQILKMVGIEEKFTYLIQTYDPSISR